MPMHCQSCVDPVLTIGSDVRKVNFVDLYVALDRGDLQWIGPGMSDWLIGRVLTFGDWLTLFWRIGESLTDWPRTAILFADS